MTQSAPRIAVFDSGIGGLSVLSELQKHLPHFEYHYYFDNAFFPYGTKSDEMLTKRLEELMPTLVKHGSADLLVIACNTASTLLNLENLRKNLHIPVVAVVPAVKPAAQISKTKVIGILATEATVRRPYTDSLIQQFASHCEVVKVGSRKLVDIAEAKIRGQSYSLESIKEELSPFFQRQDLDVVVLACTHFDHLREDFEKLASHPIRWFSSANAIAERVKFLTKAFSSSSSILNHRIVSTKEQAFDEATLKSLFKTYGFKVSSSFF